MSQRPGQRRAIHSAPPEKFFAELSLHADARVAGGKAQSLYRLAAAGCPVPPGFVVRDEIARALVGAAPRWPRALDERVARRLIARAGWILKAAWPPVFVAALRARLAGLPGRRFCVRSSFALEDARGHNAPGVYESVINVTADGVADAIRKVVASALSPGAVAYALAAGCDPLAAPLAVLIHPYVEASATGHAAMVRAGRALKVAVWIRTGRLTERRRQRLTACLKRSALVPPVEVEWAAHGDGFTFLQARPWGGGPTLARPVARQGKTNARAWHWDAAHNHLPLSPAQADLVALVDRRCQVGFRQRVRGGYLFYRPDRHRGPAPLPLPAARALFERLDRQAARELARIVTLASPIEALQAARALFVTAYQPLLGAVGRTVREARVALADFLGQHLCELAGLQGELLLGVPSVATRRRDAWTRVAAARGRPARLRAWLRYQAQFGSDTPIWDVAIATVGERPVGAHQVPAHVRRPAKPAARAAAAARRIRARLSSAARGKFSRLLRAARAAAALGEDDDWLYARLQAAVRHALLRVGRLLVNRSIIARPDDVFQLPIGTSLALARAGKPARGVKPAIKRARARIAAQTLTPPLPAARGAVQNPGGRVVTGIGVGGYAVGRVRLHPAPANAPRRRGAPDAVLVARALLPTELPLLDACALVTETGGWLDHVAAQARERNLPAVVGATGALDEFTEGDLVLVDGTHGVVQRLAGPPPRAPR